MQATQSRCSPSPVDTHIHHKSRRGEGESTDGGLFKETAYSFLEKVFNAVVLLRVSMGGDDHPVSGYDGRSGPMEGSMEGWSGSGPPELSLTGRNAKREPLFHACVPSEFDIAPAQPALLRAASELTIACLYHNKWQISAKTSSHDHSYPSIGSHPAIDNCCYLCAVGAGCWYILNFILALAFSLASPASEPWPLAESKS
ncbi:hypothetical protein EVAR_42466_1 [Eumeta japonica]|uniref:Uncharacterized protein n=1 Tax=Eumeta variegata TaxID=151549 RepID=A0A4C1Y2R2_EUMVA|nr:hypothetical protein EVAR_42466_1 [Eumeta japonica]